MNQILFLSVELSLWISAKGKYQYVHEQELARRVQDLINDNYDELINGNFPHITSTVLADLHTLSESETEDEEEQ